MNIAEILKNTLKGTKLYSPAIQYYMDKEGFEENATLITPNESMGIGSSTYLVKTEWLKNLRR